ncbi:transposase [Candidatus Bipolaricaulota bacterium]|nr:transposase [Candidatus Bipolaricaulota bacterium]
MARSRRIEYPGAVYHVTSRGNAKRNVFLDNKDRLRFLEILKQVVDRFNWLCHTYCLMTNHYHLLIETIDPTLSRGMRQLNGVYTQAFNRHHRQVGHLFQGRFKAIIVEKEEYLLELARYVVLNPVRAHMVQTAKDYRWSSYRATAGLAKKPQLLTTDWLLEQFTFSRSRAERAYRRFVSQGANASPWEQIRGQIYLGSDSFIDSLPQADDSLLEVPRQQRLVNRPSLLGLLTPDQNVDTIYRAYRDYGYTQREIAQHLGVHYATISRRISKWEESAKAAHVDLQDLTP